MSMGNSFSGVHAFGSTTSCGENHFNVVLPILELNPDNTRETDARLSAPLHSSAAVSEYPEDAITWRL